MTAHSANDDVGYGRPPKHTQFKKGQSGNPQGRPRSTPSFKSDLAAELQEKLAVTENGKERRITKQRAFIKTLTAAAIKKDIRAVNALLACMRFFGVGLEEQTTEDLDLDDLDLIENYLRQQRKRQSRSNADQPAKTSSKNALKKRGSQWRPNLGQLKQISFALTSACLSATHSGNLMAKSLVTSHMWNTCVSRFPV